MRQCVADFRDREPFASRFGLVSGLRVRCGTLAKAFGLNVSEAEVVCDRLRDRIRPDLDALSGR